MGAVKQGSKGGGRYVGSFLQMFDWNAKSRKKLFSNYSDLPEQLKQGKKFEGNMPMTRLILMDEDATIGASSIKGSSDYSCASSVTEDEAYISKPPGAVARLMGLDALPTSNFSEPCSQPFFDSQSHGDSRYTSRNLKFHQTHEISHSGNVLNREDGSVRSTLEPKPLKMPSKPIEKFQTEVLPPKSTKSIPITHHNLLSPIKNPRFNYTKNAAEIMEVAAKIIEPGPQTTSKAKMPPFKVRELKERAEAAQSRARDRKEKTEPTNKQSRLVESSRRPFECKGSMYHLKGQSLNRSWDGPDTSSFMVLPDNEESSDTLRNNGKSISLALQAKVNVQRREGLNSSVSKNYGASSVLTQNNQKQNCVVDKNKLSSKPTISVSQGRKTVSVDSSFGKHKTSSKLLGNSKSGARKTTDDGNEVLYSNTKNFPRKKRIIDKEFNFEQDHTVDSKYLNSSDSKVPKEGTFDWVEDSRKKGIDVVSFSFTAPMSRSQLTNSDRSKLSKSASLGFNVMGSDALSILLEQKFKEITIGARCSRGDSVESESTTSSSVLRHFSPTISDVTYQLNMHDKMNPQELFIDRMRSQIYNEFSSNDTPVHNFQGVDEDQCSINSIEADKQLFHHRNPSPVSILESSFSTESSSDSNDKLTEGQSNQYPLSIHTQEAIDLGSFNKFNSIESETAEFLDSASSTSIKPPWTRKHKITFSPTDSKESSATWELEYVKEILCNIEFMFNEFSLGRSSKIVNPRLFYQLENRRSGFQPQRKVLFDCVCECLDMRCKTWAKGSLMVRKKECLAEEIYNEISSWGKMGDSMVDELVDKDMSSKFGKWADFEVESFEIGVEIEGLIFNSMVNDLVADILSR